MQRLINILHHILYLLPVVFSYLSHATSIPVPTLSTNSFSLFFSLASPLLSLPFSLPLCLPVPFQCFSYSQWVAFPCFSHLFFSIPMFFCARFSSPSPLNCPLITRGEGKETEGEGRGKGGEIRRGEAEGRRGGEATVKRKTVFSDTCKCDNTLIVVVAVAC